MTAAGRTPWWAWAWPALACAILLVVAFAPASGFLAAAAAVILFGTVFAAVYHAEVVAHRVGEPFGTLVLAVAVTIIEVALIVSIMLASPADKAGLPRDTVFAAVMIVCNGIVGLCLLSGGARHHEQEFHLDGAKAALAVLAALTCLTLIFPNVATTAPGPFFSTSQLVFAGVVSLVLYGSFVFVQTVRHRDYFLPVEAAGNEEAHAPPPSEHRHAGQRGVAARRARRRRRPCEGADADAGGRDRQGRRAEGRGRHRHRGARSVARRSGGAARGAPEPPADEPQSRARLGAREHRADHPGGRDRLDRARTAAGVGTQHEGSSAACPDAGCRRDHARHRPHHGAAGHRASGDLRGVPVFLRSAFECP